MELHMATWVRVLVWLIDLRLGLVHPVRPQLDHVRLVAAIGDDCQHEGFAAKARIPIDIDRQIEVNVARQFAFPVDAVGGLVVD